MRILVATGVLAAVAAGAVAITAWVDDGGSRPAVAHVRLDGNRPSVHGVAYFEQDGARLKGSVVVWGLQPGTEHAVHFHGPAGRCGAKADPVAAHADLRANEDGVAYATVSVPTELDLLRGDFYYNVHAGPTREGENPEIACGDITTES